MFRLRKSSLLYIIPTIIALILFGVVFAGGTTPVTAAPSCSSPTTITGGGSFSITTSGTCFKYVNSSFLNGGMFSVMKDASSTSDTVQWYGATDQNSTSCSNQSATISGNGGQINNFTIGKDSTGAMYVSVTGSAANTVTISIQNWQNGAGCSVKPTPVSGGGGGATNTATFVPPTKTLGGPTATKTKTPVPSKTNTPGGPTATKANTNTPVPTTVKTNTPVPTTGGTATKPPATSTTGPTAPPGTHLSNPFSGAKWFVNPFWANEVKSSNVTSSQKSTVSSRSTFVWLDSMDAVNGTNGYPASLSGFLDLAESQGATLIGIVVYDLPGRDCSALASNGELPNTTAGLQTYESSYIDPIVSQINQSKYSNLRIIAVIEPDSLPNLVTNLNMSKCSTANSLGLYQSGIEYALNKLHAISNVYNYMDIGHAGWLGWSSNFGPAQTLYQNVLKATTKGFASTDGFIDNTANDQVIKEPFISSATQSIGGQPVQSATFFSYNPYIEEDTYDAAWISGMQSAGMSSANTNMIIDTSRNGWGGCGGSQYVSQQCRPTAASTSTDVNTFVNQSRIDRRPAKGDWCNQNGGGLGLPPGTGSSPYQAYVWVKPPGESDGSSSLIPTGPNNPGGKGFDSMCDPSYMGNSLNQNMNTNALPNAPVSGMWFEAQFEQLVANSYPAIQ